MNTRALGARREQVLALVPCRSVVADVGSGDGHVAVELVRRGRAQRVIATEKAKGPLRKVAAYVDECGLAAVIEVRPGEGLAPLAVGEAPVLVIAGMGALTIREMLRAAPAHVASLQALVLQPLNDVGPLRKWLWARELGITYEVLVQEKGRLYSVMVVQPDKPSSPLYSDLGDLNFQLGTYLLKTGHPQLGRVLNRLERQCLAVLTDLEQAAGLPGCFHYWQERHLMIKEARRIWQQHAK